MGGNLVFAVQRAEKLPAEWISMLLSGNRKRVHGRGTAHSEKTIKKNSSKKEVVLCRFRLIEQKVKKYANNEIFSSDVD